MDLGSESRTSQAVALTRAAMSRPHTEQGDPDAQRRLCEGMAPIRRPRPGIWERTRFFDDQVMAAVAAGISQVVICGAGYDDRALRFRSPGVTVRPAAAWVRLLAECGWAVCSQADPRSGSGAEGRSLLVVARVQELLRAVRTPCESAPPSRPGGPGRRNAMKPGVHLVRGR
jgi:Leucine carboxyl methyltransferase